MQKSRECSANTYPQRQRLLLGERISRQDTNSAAIASVLGARRRSFERPFKYKKEKPRNSLIYLNRDGQFLSENGQFLVFNGQKNIAKLAE